MDKEVIELLKKLIAIPSYLGDGVDESTLAEFIYKFLIENTHLKVEKQTVEGKRFNIVAYDNKKPSIIFFSHMDTVPPKIRTLEPFKARKSGNKIYGLGSVDMKAGLSVCMSLAKKFKSSKNIAYIFTVDEEYEFKGALKLLEKYQFKPDIIINPEPTSLEISNGCRGVTEFSFNVHGRSCHAGTKYLGINAIEKAITMFEMIQKDISKYDNEGGNNSLNLAHLNGGILKNDRSISYSGNVVPDYAFCVGEIRLSDKRISRKWIADKIKTNAKELGIKVSEIKFKFLMKPAYTPKSKLEGFEKIAKQSGIKPIYKDINSAGYFEVQLLQESWGSDILIFGPGPANQAHKENEYVDIDSVIKTNEIFEDYIKTASFK